MLSSLRSRFSLTFALLVAIVFVMATIMLLLVARSIPIRTNQIRLQEVSRIIYQREDLAGRPEPEQAALLRSLADRNQIRILITDRTGQVAFDTGDPVQNHVRRIPISARINLTGDEIPSGTFRDDNRRPWQYIIRPLDDARLLILAAPQPRFLSLTVLSDDILPPLLWVTFFTLLLAILLAGLNARWVSRPLSRIVDTARRVPAGHAQPIEESGPQEVQQLARAFNDMNAQVQAGKRAQQDFVANVSHELKTPLTAIQGFAQAIGDGTAASQEEIAQAAAIIQSEAGRMHRLVIDLLDLARIEGGTLRFELQPVLLHALLENLVEKFRPIAAEKAIALDFRSADLPPVMGDGDRLMQVFNNLLDNAIKHSPEGSRVRIQTEQDAEFVQVHFIDSGPGIPEGERDRIFERFYQLDKARAHRAQDGFGLGLAIAQEIVHAHHGNILLESQSGRGSDFVVKLPSTQHAGAGPGPKA